MSLVIGIDIGTSGVRAVALDDAGATRAEGRATLPASRREGAAARQDPDDWQAAVEAALDATLAGIDRSAIGAIAIDGTSGTVVGLDAGHRPIGLARMYDDAASVETASRIGALAPAESAAHGATSGLAKAIDILAATGAARIVHQADLIAYRFADLAEPVTDENNALKTGYDPVARRWPDFIEALGVDRASLPRAVAPGTPLARLRPAVAHRFGLDPSVVVAAGTTDGCASFLATGADAIGDGVSALGTTLTVKLLSDRPVFSPRHGVYSHRLGDLWLLGGASNSGGAALLAHFSAERLAALEPELKPERPTGLDYYPLPKPGERFPIADPTLEPRLTPRPTDDTLFLQGLLEGIAGIERRGYAVLAELGGPRVRRVLTVGGGARNRPWRAIRERGLGVPVTAAASEEAAVGTARLARRALGA